MTVALCDLGHGLAYTLEGWQRRRSPGETAEPLQYDPRVPLRKDAKIELIRSVPLLSGPRFRSSRYESSGWL
jgi:hypothetical protein